MNTERLIARVKAVNAAHQYAIELYPRLVDFFRPFVGQKIITQNTDFLHKIRSTIPELSCTPRLNVFKNRIYQSLSWTVRTSEQAGEIAVYHEVSVYVGKVDAAVLTGFHNAPVLRTDFTVDEIVAKRKELQAAISKVDQIRGKLFPFGENDY